MRHIAKIYNSVFNDNSFRNLVDRFVLLLALFVIINSIQQLFEAELPPHEWLNAVFRRIIWMLLLSYLYIGNIFRQVYLNILYIIVLFLISLPLFFYLDQGGRAFWTIVEMFQYLNTKIGQNSEMKSWSAGVVLELWVIMSFLHTLVVCVYKTVRGIKT